MTAIEKDKPEVKMCKFLVGTDCLVSADVDGYLNFFAVPPSPIKGQLMCRVREFNDEE